MTISKELLLAILSMDSYNRGHGEGIGDLGGIGTLVGSVEILRQSDISEDGEAQAAGFYAIAYDVDASGVDGLTQDTTVISYRGTDNPDFCAARKKRRWECLIN